MSKKFRYVLLLILSFTLPVLAQTIKVSKIEPPNWWTGMQYNNVQLMVYGENLGNIEASFNSPELKVKKVHKISNSTYAFIDVEVSLKAQAGDYVLTLRRNKEKQTISFPLLKRTASAQEHHGFTPADVIYMITPDRFADGDTSNNEIAAMNDHYNPTQDYGRHGGDIQGILRHLDYIAGLGVTAVWINPLLENNQRLSYHGYAVTDLYNIDARFGTNEQYKQLVSAAHSKGLKIILDHVNNHIGIFHPWLKNLPMEDWINGSAAHHTSTRHINSSYFDIHSESSVKDFNNTGWFVDEMPDLNQRNPFVAKYLIQNTLWWIEFSGLDGIREDTYPYSDQRYLSEWNRTIMREYPKFNIVGEVWMGDPAFLAPFQSGSHFPRSYSQQIAGRPDANDYTNDYLPLQFDTNLPAVTDFAFRDASIEAIAEGKGIQRVYNVLAKDYLFANPDNLVTFVDNHDIERIMYMVKSDVQKFKLAEMLLLTTRGIPQIYYGDEIGIVGGSDHGKIRADFPGGFPNSGHNAFTKAGRTAQENELYDFMQKLLSVRKASSALNSGKLIHFPPEKELYCYLRKSNDQTVLVALNNGKDTQTINFSAMGTHFSDTRKLINLMTGKEIKFDKAMQFEVKPFEGLILQLQ